MLLFFHCEVHFPLIYAVSLLLWVGLPLYMQFLLTVNFYSNINNVVKIEFKSSEKLFADSFYLV